MKGGRGIKGGRAQRGGGEGGIQMEGRTWMIEWYAREGWREGGATVRDLEGSDVESRQWEMEAKGVTQMEKT